MIVAGAIVYPDLPDRIPMHWNIIGEVDSYYPKRERYGQFQGAFRVIRYSFVLFMTFVFAVVMSAPLGYDFIRVEKLVPGALGVLFIVLGIVLPRVKTTWFVGIRTPWTLENEDIRKKTHAVGGVTFSVAGVLTLFSLFLPPFPTFIVTIAAATAAALIPVVYSYVLYERNRNRTGK